MADMRAKGRDNYKANIGQSNAAAKLTNEQVRYIRLLYFAEGRTTSELAKFFNVGKTTIKGIVSRRTWQI